MKNKLLATVMAGIVALGSSDGIRKSVSGDLVGLISNVFISEARAGTQTYQKLSPKEVKRQLIEMAKKYKTVSDDEKEEVILQLDKLEKSMDRKDTEYATKVEGYIKDLKMDITMEQNFDIDSIKSIDLSEYELNEKVGKEIVEGKLKSVYLLSKMTKITDNQLESLVKYSWYSLSLRGLKKITDIHAQILAKYKGYAIDLDGLKELTDNQAKSLAKFKGDELKLDGLKELTDNQAKSLAKFKGDELKLNGLKEITENQATSFAGFGGERLYLNGIKELTENQAEQLAKFKGVIITNYTNSTILKYK